ncbi:hypothetical protein EVAR_40931_1 [Eumeta japonica]|uniref:Uncharacterized protein n=1 Tax=Eumeta variegata TaxID=151549 RepID=A0A4C1X649_EUMVA|nr:hypothetical protein EVAR_40931_1 [Eumeta japonica]
MKLQSIFYTLMRVTRLQYEFRPAKYHTLTEYRSKVADSAVVICSLSENFDDPFFPPHPIFSSNTPLSSSPTHSLFHQIFYSYPKRLETHWCLFWDCECPWAAMTTYSLITHMLLLTFFPRKCYKRIPG